MSSNSFAIPATTSSPALSLPSSTEDFINQMEETQDHNSCDTKVKANCKFSKSFNEGCKPRLKNTKDLTLVVKKKFNKLKKYVNLDLLKFTQDWSHVLEKSNESDLDRREILEYIFCTANQCAKMPTEEFWFKCESIVQELDNKRQKLPIGTLKRAHTSLLFILTQCTRLLQVLKEDTSRNQEFWFLNADNFR